MNSNIEAKYTALLNQRLKQNTFRKLLIPDFEIDFFSNDYLGLAQDDAFQNLLFDALVSNKKSFSGSTGSRLISGNSKEISDMETYVAHHHQVEAALFFPSGFVANLALFSCISSKGDTVIVDEYIHRSVHDGCKLSNALKWKFKHNDLNHLEALLKKAKGNCFVAVESLYSMDGDFAPLEELIVLTSKYNANLIVDEAHAFAVFGFGKLNEKKLQNQVFATVVTYGKGLGCDGASILGTNLLKDYLINYASSFIYSTAPSKLQALKISEAYRNFNFCNEKRIQLQENIKLFRALGFKNGASDSSPIQTVFFKDTAQLDFVSTELKKMKLGVYAIKNPTVPINKERLRICLHAFNTVSEIKKLGVIIKQYKNEYEFIYNRNRN